MSTKLTDLVSANYILLARSFIAILGCIAIWWGIVGFHLFWQVSSTERIASRIIAGDPFKVEILAQQLPIISSIERSVYCLPAALRSAVIIRLRIVEETMSAGDRGPIDEQLKSAGDSIRNSIYCSPADSFLWLALWWLESTQNAFRPTHLGYLRMSYRLGPHEGWVALKRNRLAFAIFEELPSDLAESTINEFLGVLKLDVGEAVKIFTGPAWRVRDLILPHLKDVDERDRLGFATVLASQGYDVTIPGVERSMISRPWH